ncbi:hypothetical protein GCM10010954_14550 [Halobacillus andaensis]|uniref:Uncharacterized protein n=1 Tax=Halobacillus andaensis TaxID=1176239 RepID=A0A917B1U5_HALAA|nr:hypothetical protein GCM10010954_14550 [Halobacillus andaensis]
MAINLITISIQENYEIDEWRYASGVKNITPPPIKFIGID